MGRHPMSVFSSVYLFLLYIQRPELPIYIMPRNGAVSEGRAAMGELEGEMNIKQRKNDEEGDVRGY